VPPQGFFVAGMGHLSCRVGRPGSIVWKREQTRPLPWP